MSIYLTAIVKSKPGSATAMKALLLDMVKGSKAEAACIQYDLHQSQEDENMFIFHEEWANASGLTLHGQSEHVNAFREHSKEVMDGPLMIYSTAKLA